MFTRLSAIASIGLIAAGCGGTRAAAPAHGPVDSLGAPHGYRVQHVWHANLSGGRSRDIVVSSIGRPVKTLYGQRQRPMELRVLSRDRRTGRWTIAFDAQKVVPDTPCAPQSTNYVPCTPDPRGIGAPLLNPRDGTSLVRIRFAHLVSRRRDDLVFSTATPPGADGGFQAVLAVVDFGYGEASLPYSWSGGRGLRWHVAHRRIYGEAEYYQGIDTPLGDIRPYRFTVTAPRSDYEPFVETSDDRAWLGAVLGRRNNRVVGIEPHTPAQHALRIGDVLVRVINPPSRDWPMTVGGKIRSFHAGTVARLLVDRDGHRIVVSVRLGSLKDSFSLESF